MFYKGEKNVDIETWSSEKRLLTTLHLGDTGSAHAL